MKFRRKNKVAKEWKFALILTPAVVSKITEVAWRTGLAGYYISAPVRWDAQKVFSELQTREFQLLVIDAVSDDAQERRRAQELFSAVLYSQKRLVSAVVMICRDDNERSEYWDMYVRAIEARRDEKNIIPELVDVKIVSSWFEHRVIVPFEIMRFFGRT